MVDGRATEDMAADWATQREAERWQAVLLRQATSEDAFVYAVRTTGVFCRPTCSSRRPLAKNVELFDSAAEAVQRGYRPCKRCEPIGPPRQVAMLERACALLCRDAPIEAREVARSLGVSRSHFQRLFKKHLGVTPRQYRRRVVAETGRALLSGSPSVTESIYAAGYSSSSRFYDGVGRELGMVPSAARRGAPGEHIDFATAQCTLGRVLIAWTDQGVCAVSLGDEEEELVAQLEAQFPAAALTASAPPPWIGAVVDAVDGRTHPELSLDVRGTAFQERVWQALRTIPLGETRTYTEIAEAVGASDAVRAVANACARNELAVLIPCHRAVRKDGSLAGYRWGVERKRQLLAREAGSVEKT